MFSKSVLLAGLFLCSSTFAVPTLPAAGTYRSSGVVRSLGRLRSETVYGFVQAGRARLEALLKQNYRCENTGREIYRCAKFEGSAPVPPEIATRARAEVATVELRFFEPRGTPILIHDGEAVKEWGVPQTVVSAGKTHEAYRYLESADVAKIFLGIPSQATFIVSPGNTLGVPFEIPVTESREVYFRYVFEGDLVDVP